MRNSAKTSAREGQRWVLGAGRADKAGGEQGGEIPTFGRAGWAQGWAEGFPQSLPGFPQSLPPVLSELRLCDERGCFGSGFWLDTWSM